MNQETSPRLHHVKCLSPAGFHRMAYAEWGAPDNPRVLVCVHGLTRVGRDFDRLARALSSHYRVVCPDVVGRGRSDWLRDPNYYVIPQYVSDMAALVARLDVEEVDWVGTSMGGLIGIAVAGQAGSPIRRLVAASIAFALGRSIVTSSTAPRRSVRMGPLVMLVASSAGSVHRPPRPGPAARAAG